MSERRKVMCPCCEIMKELPTTAIDVGQEKFYCVECYNNCSYAYSNGETQYYHEIRTLNIIQEKEKEVPKKTNRGFNIWEPLVTKRREKIQFHEISAVGLNVWLKIFSLNLNDPNAELERKTIRLDLEECKILRDKLDEVIEFLNTVRRSWYE